MTVDSAVRRMVGALALVLAFGIGVRSAHAIEAFEGRLQIHGYFEEQIRGINNDFKENFDLTQWYHVLNVETEIDILPDGWGPIGGLSAYIGIDVRYDCVWTRACGMFRSADTFGDRASKVPVRLGNARFGNTAGVLQASGAHPDNPSSLNPGNANVIARVLGPTLSLGSSRRLGGPDRVSGLATLFGQRGVDNALGTIDDPGTYTFGPILDYKFAMRATPGGDDGIGIQTLGPWLPRNTIVPNGMLADRVSPFNDAERNPNCVITATNNCLGSTFLPYRPKPTRIAGHGGDPGEARGLFVPSPATQAWLRSGELNSFDQNFRATELQWNRGASQQDEKFLKEAYLDWEMLDGRLFLRTGKQTIVWGKTELFATTDQFNPRDLALATLPSLEESRIALWSIRGVYSLYEVGPFEDVRFEFALNLDDFEPEDLGRCGEAYTPNPVCNKTAGLFAHGIVGYGVIGEDRPQHWWNSAKGLQGGAKIEFRWDRFSFAITDIYNYTRIPYAERVFTYSRNVDPNTGRPREAMSDGSCTTGSEGACLTPAEALTKHSLNQQLFAVICSSSVGFSTLDRSVCAQSVFTSIKTTTGGIAGIDPGFVLTQALSAALAGNALFAPAVYLSLAGATPSLAVLHLAASDDDGNPVSPVLGGGLAQALSVQQEALLGCGLYYGSACEFNGVPFVSSGMDLLNAEASALIQSWNGFDGPFSPRDNSLTVRMDDATRPQPGTVEALGQYGPVATRWVAGRGVVQLPGARSPWLPGASASNPGGLGNAVYLNPLYDPRVDGCVQAGFDGVAPAGTCAGVSITHPLATGQIFSSEMAAFSWNLLELLVAFSSPDPDGGLASTGRFNANEINEFDEFNQNRLDGCSFVLPHLCSSVTALYSVIGNRRNDVRAGGNGNFGRRDMIWAGGGEVVLRYEKRNVLGFSMDFAEDVTKSNWGMEAAWIDGLPFEDADQVKNISKSDTWNLTLSVDRPTFINFLNANRTFFFNSQVFVQYISGYRNSYQTNGPWNMLGTFTIITGYFQDRLNPAVTFVYDVKSNSAAVLPSIGYRFTENFSATIGVALFSGRWQDRKMSLEPVTLSNHAGGEDGAYHNQTEQGVSVVRDRDEVFLRVRYTF